MTKPSFNPCRIPLKPRWLAAVLEKLLALDVLGAIYDRRPQATNSLGFLNYTLEALGVSLHLNKAENLDEIPATGPLLIVANHPLGGLEGVALAKIIAEFRPDLQVLTNQLLCRIPELSDIFIGVDVLSNNAASGNISGIKQVHRHLKNNGAVLIFPAGMVATYQFAQGRIQDKAWHRFVGQLVKRHQCACLPINVEGRNSLYFYAAGMIHPRLRTALLPRQLANKRGYRLPLTIGRVIPFRELAGMQNPKAITEYLRIATDALVTSPGLSSSQKQSNSEAVAVLRSTVAKAELFTAIEQLADCRLIEHEAFDVYCSPYSRLGVLMEQIAIARELSFRAVGEGTGLSKDSDQFDAHYLHLFLWDKSNGRIAGAYRVGLVDKIVAEHSIKGLYSRSLYKYDEAFIAQLGPAIEMGRSFIHPDYQRRSVSLSLLWRGIGQILLRNPAYHTLFGSVSISREYSDLARAIIADSMMSNYQDDGLAGLVRPSVPHKIKNRVWTKEVLQALANIKILSKLIGRCDPGKSLPVLLRHYLSLNGRLVCFNIHPNFNDSLEGLIVVDVRNTDAKTASRFMGAQGYEQFMAEHGLEKSA